MNRGEVWRVQVGRERRPVVVLTRTAVIDVRQLVTVAEVTTSMRGLSTEVNLDHVAVGLDRPSAVNCDGLHTVAQSTLTTHLGTIDDDAMQAMCGALTIALGC